MKANIVVDISPPIPYLEKFWFSSAYSAQNTYIQSSEKHG